MEQISGCQAVERAITILELFDEHRTVVGVGDAARALGVHRSTASRLMATLERRGLLEQAEGSASYRLGLGLVPLAGYVLNRFPVRAQAGQVLRELRDATGETAWLGVLDAHKITYLDQASSRHVTVNVDWVGVRHELTEGVTGRLLLAYQPGDVIDRLVAEAPAGAPGLSDTELAQVRRQGHAIRISEGEDGYCGVAVPIRDAGGWWWPRSLSEARGSASPSSGCATSCCPPPSMPLPACPKPWVTGPLDDRTRTRLLPGCGAVRALLRRAGRGRPAARRRDAPARLAGRPAARLGHRRGGPRRSGRRRRRQDGGLRPQPAGRLGRGLRMRAGGAAGRVVHHLDGGGHRFVGAGIGLFWVSSQTLLGRSSGGDGSERAFAHHYAAYTLGVAGGSAIVGSTAAILRHAGIGEADAIQLSYGLGLAAMLAGLALWRPRRQRDAVPAGCARAPRPRPWRCSCQTCCWSRRWP